MRPELVRRLAQLDAQGGDILGFGDARADLAHFMEVLGRVTSAGTPRDLRTMSAFPAREADRVLARSRLLARLAQAAPELVMGPVRRDAQVWMGTTKPPWRPAGDLTPTVTSFHDLTETALVMPSTKPFYVGMFTSTAALGTLGMWRLYVEAWRDSNSFPRPWHTWIVTSSSRAVVHEISSARAWVDFVLSHPRREGGLLYPDWKSVARSCDAVHMTLQAIVATQGFWFSTNEGIVATTFWDVESTFWLRWCVESARLVEIVT